MGGGKIHAFSSCFSFFSHKIRTETQSPVKIAPHCSNKSLRGHATPQGEPPTSWRKMKRPKTAIMRDHRRLHARAAEWNRAGGTSRALTAAKLSTNWRNDQATPVATEEFRVRRSLSSRALVHTAPSPLAVPVPSATELRRTMIVLKRETSMAPSSLAATARFMSRSIALQRAVAPASRQTLAKVLSGANARVLSLLERLHAALWRPVLSNAIPHSHTFSVTPAKANLSLSQCFDAKLKLRRAHAQCIRSARAFFPKVCSKDEEA